MIAALIARGDPDALDRAVEEMGVRAMLDALLAGADEALRSKARACLPSRRGAFTRIDVQQLVAIGPVGLHEAGAWALRELPGFETHAPLPWHEQWDAVMEIFRDRAETIWLPIELLASLHASQRSLGRRIALGHRRRYPERGPRVAAARLRMGECPLADLLEELARGPL